MAKAPLFTKEEIKALASALGSMRQKNPRGRQAGAQKFDVVEGLLAMIPESVREKADKIYEMWSEKQPNVDVVTKIVWPENQIVLGTGRKIGYTSDKWQKNGSNRDYVHDFDLRHPPKLIMEHDASLGRDILKYAKKLKRPIKPPKHPMLVGLGKALDVEFLLGGQVRQWDWKEGQLPWLLIDTQRNLLIIQQEDGRSPALLLDSPVVEITARGIEN